MAAPKLHSKSTPDHGADTPSAPGVSLHETNPFWQSTLFSDVYLRNDVPDKYRDIWEHEEAGPFYVFCEQFRNLCEEIRGESFESWSERTTINRFIKPIRKRRKFSVRTSVV
jgi:hypothetical protein